jgi:hypothetical protein
VAPRHVRHCRAYPSERTASLPLAINCLGFRFQTAVIASASEAIHRTTRNKEWIASSLPLLAMTSGYTSTISPRKSREFCHEDPAQQTEGAGNAGRTMRPQPCVQNNKAHKRSHHGHTGITRHSPRNGFNGFLRTLPGDRAFLPPSPRRNCVPQNLTPASGRQDHTTSPSASGALRRCAPSASTASRLTSMTIAKRPSREAGRGELVEVICPT